jgi:hypothetical protein
MTNAAARYTRRHADAIAAIVNAADAIADGEHAATYRAIADVTRHVARVYHARAADIDARAAVTRDIAAEHAMTARVIRDAFAYADGADAEHAERVAARYANAANAARRAALRDAARAERYAMIGDAVGERVFAARHRHDANTPAAIAAAITDAIADAIAAGVRHH